MEHVGLMAHIFCNARGTGERIDNTMPIKSGVLSQLEYKKKKQINLLFIFKVLAIHMEQ